MAAHGGLITTADLKAYQAKKRVPVRGTYRGYDILGMPPISSGGTALLEMLNILEGYDLAAQGFGSAANVHVIAESDAARVRRSRALPGRPRFDVNTAMPIDASAVQGVREGPRRLDPRGQGLGVGAVELRVAGRERRDDALLGGGRGAQRGRLTYTLEDNYGVKIVVPGGGFLLNNEMGDFNAGPGLTDKRRPDRHRAQPGRAAASACCRA